MDYLQQHWEKLALVFGFLCLALFGYQYLTVRQQTSESGEVSELETQVSELLNRRSPVNPEVNDYLARVKAPWQGEVEPVTEKYFAFHMPLLIHLTKEKVVEEKYQLPNFAKDERGRFRIEKKVTLENGVQVKCVLETIEETKKIKEATPDIIELQRKLPSEEEWTTVDSVKQPGSQKEFSFSDTNVEARTTYAYRIRFHVDPEKIEKKEDAELVTPATRSSDVMKVTTKGIFRIQFITTGGDSANIGVQKYNRDSQQWEPGLDQWEKYWVEPGEDIGEGKYKTPYTLKKITEEPFPYHAEVTEEEYTEGGSLKKRVWVLFMRTTPRDRIYFSDKEGKESAQWRKRTRDLYRGETKQVPWNKEGSSYNGEKVSFVSCVEEGPEGEAVPDKYYKPDHPLCKNEQGTGEADQEEERSGKESSEDANDQQEDQADASNDESS